MPVTGDRNTSGAGAQTASPVDFAARPPADLPGGYADDRLVLLARDPRTLFAYWDLHPDTLRTTLAGLDDARVVLRLVALDRDTIEAEYDVDLAWTGYYVHDRRPGGRYRVELVARGQTGIERLVVRPSREALLPPDGPSEVVDDRFVRWPDVVRGDRSTFRLAAAALHARAFALSGADVTHTGDVASSDRGTVAALGGRTSSDFAVRSDR